MQDGFAWTIIDLTPGVTYEVEVTVTASAISDVRTLMTTTRALPAAAGTPNKTANSAATIASQIASLNPGDVLEIAAGTYTLNGISLTRSGSPGAPIYVRGASRTGTVIQRTGVGAIFSLGANVSDVVIENMTLHGNGVDQDSNTATNYTEVLSGSDSWTATRVTLRNLIATGVDRGCDLYRAIQLVVYDNSFTGNNLWQTSPVNFLGTNRTWNDDGMNLAGHSNVAFNNTMTGFGDTFSYAQHSGNDTVTGPNSNIHYYRNEIRNSCDDVVEVDHARRNCSFYDNRAHNVMTATSLDPLYGGPFLYARNVIINTGSAQMHKWNDTNTGQFCYNNTIISTVKGVRADPTAAQWYQPNNGSQRSYGYRNNIHIGPNGTSKSFWLESTDHDPIDWTNNSWYPDLGCQWPGNNFSTIAAAVAGMPANTTPIFSGTNRRMQNDNVTAANPWTVTIALGSDSRTEVTATYLPVLAAGDAAKNSGVVIPNITDGFSGPAPDRGAVLAGRSLVAYGDRNP